MTPKQRLRDSPPRLLTEGLQTAKSIGVGTTRQSHCPLGSLEWLLGGKRAVDLARTPGGLSVILEHCKKQMEAQIVCTAARTQYPNTAYQVRHRIGIDSSSLFVAKTGVSRRERLGLGRQGWIFCYLPLRKVITIAFSKRVPKLSRVNSPGAVRCGCGVLMNLRGRQPGQDGSGGAPLFT